MKRVETIKDSNYFNLIIKTGKFKKDENFVIYSLPNDQEKNKIGIAVKKSIGNAVIRNRLKRQVRSLVDNNRNLFKISSNYIIMIRDGCLSHSYSELDNSIQKLMKG